jgi:hypothetical protein
MNKAARATSLILALLVVAFVATWVLLPQVPGTCLKWGPSKSKSLYAPALECYESMPPGTGYRGRRVLVLFGGSAVVVVLVGAAFGAGRQARP